MQPASLEVCERGTRRRHVLPPTDRRGRVKAARLQPSLERPCVALPTNRPLGHRATLTIADVVEDPVLVRADAPPAWNAFRTIDPRPGGSQPLQGPYVLPCDGAGGAPFTSKRRPSEKHHHQSSPGSKDRMIGCPGFKSQWADACFPKESLQQPTFPHVMHIRRFTQCIPA
jgi:hypothetical protein